MLSPLPVRAEADQEAVLGDPVPLSDEESSVRSTVNAIFDVSAQLDSGDLDVDEGLEQYIAIYDQAIDESNYQGHALALLAKEASLNAISSALSRRIPIDDLQNYLERLHYDPSNVRVFMPEAEGSTLSEIWGAVLEASGSESYRFLIARVGSPVYPWLVFNESPAQLALYHLIAEAKLVEGFGSILPYIRRGGDPSNLTEQFAVVVDRDVRENLARDVLPGISFTDPNVGPSVIIGRSRTVFTSSWVSLYFGRRGQAIEDPSEEALMFLEELEEARESP
jgi:hypothetical protein